MKSYTIRNAVVPVLSTALLLAVGTGCANENARYIDSGGSQSVVTLNQIDIQDWNKAGTDMVQSLLGSGTLDTAPRIPAIMAISRITNKTSEVVDTDLLTKNIRIALLQSGKVRTSTTIGLGGYNLYMGLHRIRYGSVGAMSSRLSSSESTNAYQKSLSASRLLPNTSHLDIAPSTASTRRARQW